MPTALPAPATGRAIRFMTASLARELGILVCLSVMFPVMIHLLPVPDDARLGPKLLPMFYAPLLAALWARTPSAWLLAVLAPWVNWLVTSHPAVRGAIVMNIELLVFVLVLRVLLTRLGALWFLAAPAFFCAKAASLVVVALFPTLIGGRSAVDWALQAVLTGAPGIVILVAINWLALRFYPPNPSGGGPMAA